MRFLLDRRARRRSFDYEPYPRGFDTGWTGYPPLSARAPVGIQMFFLGCHSRLVIHPWCVECDRDSCPHALKGHDRDAYADLRMGIRCNFDHRFDGHSAYRLSFQLVMFQRLFGMGFFDPAKGGNPILFQHLFWFYSHPAVYVFVLPGLGVISELLPVFVRKPLFGYRWIAMSSLGIALVASSCGRITCSHLV